MGNHLAEKYSPLYFLAALGNGGISVSFFIYLMFMIPHPNIPMVTFEHIYLVILNGNPLIVTLVLLALGAILYFAFRHFRLLLWNIKEYQVFKKTNAFKSLKKSNEVVTLMAIPLTLAMSVNVFFVLGAAFIPNLWDVIEVLLPFALLGFLVIGIYAIRLFMSYFTRFIVDGDFDFIKNNNLSQMLAIFAFSMISVGFASPGAMSEQTWVSVNGIFLSILFATIAALLGFIKFVLGFKSIFRQGIGKEGGATLWVIIPIVTLLGIAFVRVYMGIYHNVVGGPATPVPLFVVLSILISLQLFMGLVGFYIMKNTKYFDEFVYGDSKSAGSYALICPGVAFFVLGMFFIYWGLVQTGIVQLFSPVYFLLLLPLVYVQIKTIQTLFTLNKKLLSRASQKQDAEPQPST